ncbi:MAG TPA: TonB-dependent receptor plug domain-containing protein, partial [Candidatus Polarisedimenticolia bacterium]|nr:TonB-dependent receptor plug domain-containing protein [Candidatus Polarisedimenticolia bacterium]
MSAAQRKSMLTGRHALHLLALAVAAVLSGPVLAADADPDPDPNAESPKTLPGPPTSVVVEGTLPFIPTANTILTRLPLALRLTPMNVGTVNQALLEDQDAYILGDALRNVSGVNVQTVFNATDLFFIRGFDSLTSSMVLTDGAPEPEVTFYQMYNVDRVEVLKGPGGFLYGRNAQTGALSGLVNIVRKQPVPGTFGRVGASYGTFQTEDATLDYNTSWGEDKYLFRMNSAWRQSELYRDEKETRNSAINPAFTWRIGKNSSLNVNLERVDSDYEPDSGL